MHPMTVFGDEFGDGSFCWMVEDDELWLSMIIVKEEHRREGVLHRLLEDAKKVSDWVVIPEPLNVVPRTAVKHGYVSAKCWIEDYGEFIDVMEWRIS
jgi:hypothetical protein